MPKNITQRYLAEATAHVKDANKDHARENRRVRIVVITTSIFLAFFLPPLIWFTYSFMNEAYYQSAEHVESVAYANLLGRGRRGNAIGAEQQRPFDVMTARQYLQEAHRIELAAKYESRVNEILNSHNEMLCTQRISLKGNDEPDQSWYRRLIGHPKELTVKSLEISVTKHNHLMADLRIHGEPLGDDYWAQFFITNPSKLAWLFTWDNKLRADGQNTLRANIKSDLVSRMQAVPAPRPEQPARPCYPVNTSGKFSEIRAKLALAERLDDLKTLDSLNFDLELVYVEPTAGSSNLHAKAKVFCVIGHLSRGHVKFQALLCMTSVEQNTWKIISTNASDITTEDNKNEVSKCEKSLSRMKDFSNIQF